MVFPWYAIVIAGLAGTLVIAIVFIIVLRLILSFVRKRAQHENAYSKLDTAEEVCGDPDDSMQDKDDNMPVRTQIDIFQEKIGKKQDRSYLDIAETRSIRSEVAVVKHVYAEVSQSDYDASSDRESLSAYGDLGWRKSDAGLSRADTLKTDILGGVDSSRVQLSLILNEEKGYLAGKIIKIEGIPLPASNGPHQVKLHVVFLPSRKYIVKSRYYNVTTTTTTVNKYFKLKFRELPDPEKSAVRYRLYGRRVKLGISGPDKCIGEACVELPEILSSRGGVTMWKTIVPKGMSKAIEYERS
ncbi:uncharacterized protein LOC135691037 [Rhopilema esculentum]|uniref:uncharacterized protein LOC135691037 n=1 Tax=Rhopilema esculentum TaxID=499914 RepID=UPI0031DCEA59